LFQGNIFAYAACYPNCSLGRRTTGGNNFIVHLQVPIEGSGDNFISPNWSYVVIEQRTYGRFGEQLYCSSTDSLPRPTNNQLRRPPP
jgi:hypothetical protein